MSLMTVSTPQLEVGLDEHSTTLYEAICDRNWDAALETVTNHPIQARTWVTRYHDDKDGEEEEREIMWPFLPIHSACAQRPPAAIILALLKAFPDSAGCEDDQGMYALHYACGNQASEDVVRLLLRFYPQACERADPKGRVPLHYLACWGPSSVSVVDVVLNNNPGAKDAKDNDGNTPLSLAYRAKYPNRHKVVETLKSWADRSENNHGNIVESPLPVDATDESKFVYMEACDRAGSPKSGVSLPDRHYPALGTPRTVTRVNRGMNKFAEEKDGTSQAQQSLSYQVKYEELKQEFDELALALQSSKIQALEREKERNSYEKQLRQVRKDLTTKESEWTKKLSDQEGQFRRQLMMMEKVSWTPQQYEDLKCEFEETVLELQSTKVQARDQEEARKSINEQLLAVQQEVAQKDCEWEKILAETKDKHDRQLMKKEAEWEAKTEALEKLTRQLAEQEDTVNCPLSDKEVARNAAKDVKLTELNSAIAELVLARGQLQTKLSEKDQELESSLLKHRTELESKEKELLDVQAKFERQLAEKEAKLTSQRVAVDAKDASGEYASSVSDKKAEYRDQHDALCRTLDETSMERDVYKHKVVELNERLSSLAVSVTCMMKEHQKIIASIQHRKSAIVENSKSRRKELNDFLTIECSSLDNLVVDIEDDAKISESQPHEKKPVSTLITSMCS